MVEENNTLCYINIFGDNQTFGEKKKKFSLSNPYPPLVWYLRVRWEPNTTKSHMLVTILKFYKIDHCANN